MKVFVTGINGFVGRHLMPELEKRGHEVLGIDTISNDSRITEADILDDEKIEVILKNSMPDFIIHLAAISSVDHKESSEIYKVNCIGTLNLLSACIKLEKLPGFLFVSSSQVYGNVDSSRLPINESSPVEPVNHYGASKAAAEMVVKAFGMEYNLPFVIARPFNHTGPGQSDKFVIPKIINAFRHGDASIELGNIDTVRDFIDVRDVVKAYAVILEKFNSGEIYNIAGGHGLTISEIFEKIKYVTGHQMNIVKKDFLIRNNDIRAVIGDPGKLLRDTGWQAASPIETTLQDMLE